MNLTTRAKVKSHLGIPSGDSSKDAVIDQIITGVSAFMETHLNRKLGVAQYTEIFDGEDVDEIFLKQYPLVDVLSITIDGAAIELDQEEEDGIVIVDRETGSVFRQYGFRSGRKNIKVIYTAGYAEPVDSDESGDESGDAESFPNDLEAAAIRLSARVYERRTAEGVSSASPGSFSVQYKDAIDADIVSVLDANKKRRL